MNYLNYEFYFLFHTELDYDGKHCTEPLSLSSHVIEYQKNLYSFTQIDKDKRLFRYSSTSSDLTEWDKELQQAWIHILACYTTHFKQDNSYQKDKQINAFCQQAFMGVALVIMDETVEPHQIKLNTTEGEIIFKPSQYKTPTEKYLLQVEEVVPNGLHNKECMSKPAHLEEFEIDKPTNDLEDWQIQLSSTQAPCLKPVQEGENQPNPVFSVYGLAHGKLEPVDADWPDQLQAFLCSGKTSVLVYVMLRLIMQKWQFMRLHFDGVQLRKNVDLKNEVYRQQKDDYLACYSNRKLEKGLREMTILSTDAQQMLARLDAGIRTLEINRNNLERELRGRTETWQTLEEYPQTKLDWNLIWEHDTRAPMLDRFNLNIRNLQNQATYVKDALNYLGGISTHWQLHIDERRLKVSERLSVLGHFLVFLTVFGEIIIITVLSNNNNGSSNPAPSPSPNPSQLQWLIDWLTNIEQSFFIQDIGNLVQRPVVYIFAILVFILLPVFHSFWAPIREMLCHFKRKIRNKFRSFIMGDKKNGRI